MTGDARQLFLGYQAIEEGKVHLGMDIIGGMITQKILFPYTFTESTEEGVIKYLSEEASGALANLALNLPETLRPQREKSESIESRIRALPFQMLTKIALRDNGYATFIKHNTPARVLPTGETPARYVEVSYGLVPLALVEASREMGVDINFEWYGQILRQYKSDFIGPKLTLCWKLNALGNLPPINELIFNAYNEGYNTLLNVASVVYQGLTSCWPNPAFSDISHEKIKEAASPAVDALQRLIDSQKLKKGSSVKKVRIHTASKKAGKNDDKKAKVN